MNDTIRNGLKAFVNHPAVQVTGLGFFMMAGVSASETAGRVFNNVRSSFQHRRAMRKYNNLSLMQKVFSLTPRKR